MNPQITVIVSKGQSNNPKRRALEDEIANRLTATGRFDVAVTANLYDLTPTGPALSKLRETTGSLIVLSWLYPRAAHWVLDRHSIRGSEGETELLLEAEEDEAESDDTNEDNPVDRVIDARELPARSIYCIDLRASESAEEFLNEIERIARNELGESEFPASESTPAISSVPQLSEADSGRRWYPVIDFSRCTNCMECIDFCLFGVYGIDQAETILVELPDNCRKGCPACSRVCPEQAIIFPQHKSPAIAGSQAEVGGFKIDLSRLFGAPSDSDDALSVAVRERDEQLEAAGRTAVGEAIGVPKRQENRQKRPKDALDGLIEELDELDL